MNEKISKAGSLGERLYLLREEHKLSQEELAEKLNVSRQTISNWENDKVTLDVEKAAELCRLYGVSMDELFLNREKAAEKKPERGKLGVKGVAALILFVLGICLIVVSVVFLIIGRNDGDFTSAVILSGKAGWAIGLILGIAVCTALACYFFKKFRK